MISKAEVTSLIEGKLKDSDIFVVDVHVSELNQIQVEIDHKDGISIQRCVELSRFLENSLDRRRKILSYRFPLRD